MQVFTPANGGSLRHVELHAAAAAARSAPVIGRTAAAGCFTGLQCCRGATLPAGTTQLLPGGLLLLLVWPALPGCPVLLLLLLLVWPALPGCPVLLLLLLLLGAACIAGLRQCWLLLPGVACVVRVPAAAAAAGVACIVRVPSAAAAAAAGVACIAGVPSAAAAAAAGAGLHCRGPQCCCCCCCWCGLHCRGPQCCCCCCCWCGLGIAPVPSVAAAAAPADVPGVHLCQAWPAFTGRCRSSRRTFGVQLGCHTPSADSRHHMQLTPLTATAATQASCHWVRIQLPSHHRPAGTFPTQAALRHAVHTGCSSAAQRDKRDPSLLTATPCTAA